MRAWALGLGLAVVLGWALLAQWLAPTDPGKEAQACPPLLPY